MRGMRVRCYPRCCLGMLSGLTPKGKAAQRPKLGPQSNGRPGISSLDQNAEANADAAMRVRARAAPRVIRQDPISIGSTGSTGSRYFRWSSGLRPPSPRLNRGPFGETSAAALPILPAPARGYVSEAACRRLCLRSYGVGSAPSPASRPASQRAVLPARVSLRGSACSRRATPQRQSRLED